MKKSILLIILNLLIIAQCDSKNPFETEPFDLNVYYIDNHSNDTIKIAIAYKDLFEIKYDTSDIVLPNKKESFYSSGFVDGPLVPDEALASLKILIIKNGLIDYTVNIGLLEYKAERYSNKESKGYNFIYTYDPIIPLTSRFLDGKLLRVVLDKLGFFLREKALWI
jgi:hypothetical protein